MTSTTCRTLVVLLLVLSSLTQRKRRWRERSRRPGGLRVDLLLLNLFRQCLPSPRVSQELPLTACYLLALALRHPPETHGLLLARMISMHMRVSRPVLFSCSLKFILQWCSICHNGRNLLLCRTCDRGVCLDSCLPADILAGSLCGGILTCPDCWRKNKETQWEPYTVSVIHPNQSIRLTVNRASLRLKHRYFFGECLAHVLLSRCFTLFQLR